MIDEVAPLEKAERYRLYLKFTSETLKKRERIISVLRRYPGEHEVVLFDSVSGRQELAPRELCISGTDTLIEVLGNLLGRENVKLVNLK